MGGEGAGEIDPSVTKSDGGESVTKSDGGEKVKIAIFSVTSLCNDPLPRAMTS